jgi:hypothetical protein
MYFLYFWPSKIRISPTDVIFSVSPLRCHLYSDRRRHATASYHTLFPRSQNELAVSASSSHNASSNLLPSRAKNKALNPHHHCRPPSPDHMTPTVHCFKKVISILITISTIQLCLYVISSLARASRHRSSTHRRCSLLMLSQAYRPSIQ